MTVIAVTELTVSLKRIGTASYVTQRSGVAFQRMLAFQTTETVRTDRLLVSGEAVRVLNTLQ